MVEAASLRRVETKRKSGPAFRLYSSGKIDDRTKAEFCSHLAVMLHSRISLHRALKALEEQTKNPGMKAVIGTVGKEIQKGSSFSKALALHPKVFDNLFV